MKELCLGSLQYCNSWLRDTSRKPDDTLTLDLPPQLALQLASQVIKNCAKYSNTGKVSIVIRLTKISLSVADSREMST